MRILQPINSHQTRRISAAVLMAVLLFHLPATAGDLPEIRERGVLRHLAITYAHFVKKTKTGYDGLDVELMQRFAAHLGVAYEMVPTNWADAFGDLTGRTVEANGAFVTFKDTVPVKGDIIANGLTVLPWRENVVNYSIPTFPTGVWLIARADSPLKPITPSGDMAADIRQVRRLMSGKSILTMEGTCLDPNLYDLDKAGAEIRYMRESDSLNDIAPAVINGVADATLLDIPDALVALQKWPGEIKIIGPVSHLQVMGVAVDKSAPRLLAAFNRFFRTCWEDGSYIEMVQKYYPAVFLYLEDFFNRKIGG